MSADRNSQKTPEEFAEEIKKVLSASVSKSIHLMSRANNLIKETVESVTTADGKSINESELLERWLNFNVATYTVINDHALSLLEKLIAVAESSIHGKPVQEEKAKKEADISISGKPGELHSAYFLIQNHYDHPLEVSFEASPLVGANGAFLPNTHVTFEPGSTTLIQNEQMTVKVNVNITKEFMPGMSYATNIRVIGFEAKELILVVDVLQPDTAEQETPKPKTTAKSAAAGTRKTRQQPGRPKKSESKKK